MFQRFYRINSKPICKLAFLAWIWMVKCTDRVHTLIPVTRLESSVTPLLHRDAVIPTHPPAPPGVKPEVSDVAFSFCLPLQLEIQSEFHI